MADFVEEEIRELRALFWSERDPEGRAFAPLADAYRRQGDLDQALELIQDGLGRHSSFTPGHIVAAWVRRDRGELDEAGDAFGVALGLDEENSEALRGLGEIAVARGDGETATIHYQKLTELEPDDLEIVGRLREIQMSPPVPPPAPVEDAAPGPAEWQVEVADTTDELRLDEAPAAPEPTSAADEEGPITRTMADLYARQGLHERALRVYTRLLERTPDDTGLEERVATMSALVAAPAPAPPEEPAAKVAEKPAAHGTSDDAQMEKMAQAWAEGPRATGELSTPFAWTAKTAPPVETEPSDAGRPVKDYFRSLLEWEPVEIVSAAPVAEPMAPAIEPAMEAMIEPAIEVVEPERTVPVVESVAPMPVVESEAPMPAVEAEAPPTIAAVPIETLAPDRLVVTIESLAPDGIVSIESLAPVVVDIATLAP